LRLGAFLIFTLLSESEHEEGKKMQGIQEKFRKTTFGTNAEGCRNFLKK